MGSPGAGRAKLRLSRGFPRVLAQERNPSQILARIARWRATWSVAHFPFYEVN
jgi:hypothetical protein